MNQKPRPQCLPLQNGREKPWERGSDARADHVQIGVFCLSSCFFEILVAVRFR